MTNSHGFDINTIGMILMVVGAIGLFLSFLFWSSFAPYRSRRVAYVEDEPRRRVRREVVEDV